MRSGKCCPGSTVTGAFGYGAVATLYVYAPVPRSGYTHYRSRLTPHRTRHRIGAFKWRAGPHPVAAGERATLPAPSRGERAQRNGTRMRRVLALAGLAAARRRVRCSVQGLHVHRIAHVRPRRRGAQLVEFKIRHRGSPSENQAGEAPARNRLEPESTPLAT